MPTTSRRGIVTPSGSTTPVNIPADLAALAALIDVDLIWSSGVAGSRPAAGTVPAGTVYWSTDTGNLYLNTGGAWLLLIDDDDPRLTNARRLADPTVTTTLRSEDVTYQPSATRPTLVTLSVNLNHGSEDADAEIRVSAASPPTTVVARLTYPDLGPAMSLVVPVTFLVPAAHYYRLVNTGVDDASIVASTEWVL